MQITTGWRSAVLAAAASGLALKLWRAARHEHDARASAVLPVPETDLIEETGALAPPQAVPVPGALAQPPRAEPAAEARGARAVWRRFWRYAKEAFAAWRDDYAASIGAALSYYTLFSIAPLMLIVVSVAGIVFGEDAARGQIFAQLRGFFGPEGAAAIEGLLKSVSLGGKGIIGTAVGAVMLILGSTRVVAELQSALDRIWRVPEREKPAGWRGLLRARLLSLAMVLGLGFLMTVSLVASAGLSALGQWWAPLFGSWEVVLQLVNFAVGFALVTAMFALIYKWMPSVPIAWRDVWVGAAVTAMLFSIGKLAISLYIGKSGVTSGFGAASSVVVLLIWVYYSAQIFLIGAEFTWVYAHRSGSKKANEYRVEQPAPAPRVSAQGDPASAVVER